jgi:hypothetical protein
VRGCCCGSGGSGGGGGGAPLTSGAPPAPQRVRRSQALLASTPGLSSQRIVLKGELPSPLSPPPGCVFSRP